MEVILSLEPGRPDSQQERAWRSLWAHLLKEEAPDRAEGEGGSRQSHRAAGKRPVQVELNAYTPEGRADGR